MPPPPPHADKHKPPTSRPSGSAWRCASSSSSTSDSGIWPSCSSPPCSSTVRIWIDGWVGCRWGSCMYIYFHVYFRPRHAHTRQAPTAHRSTYTRTSPQGHSQNKHRLRHHPHHALAAQVPRDGQQVRQRHPREGHRRARQLRDHQSAPRSSLFCVLYTWTCAPHARPSHPPTKRHDRSINSPIHAYPT